MLIFVKCILIPVHIVMLRYCSYRDHDCALVMYVLELCVFYSGTSQKAFCTRSVQKNALLSSNLWATFYIPGNKYWENQSLFLKVRCLKSGHFPKIKMGFRKTKNMLTAKHAQMMKIKWANKEQKKKIL